MRTLDLKVSVFVLATSLLLWGCTRPVPDTGISLCYDNTQVIECPLPGEPFYGQDAQYTANSMQFADNGNGTVTDRVTGLIWQRQDDGVARSWLDASVYCESLTLAGRTDWRVPREDELQSIVRYDLVNPSIDTVFFPGTRSDWYWASSVDMSLPTNAWVVAFNAGRVDTLSKSNSLYVRCVRVTRYDQSYTDNGDGSVSDDITGLIWEKEGSSTTMDWQTALGHCETSTVAGHTDWRLPNVKELRSLVDGSRYNPAINVTHFPGTSSGEYWTSSTRTPVSAWRVDFYAGYVNDSFKTDTTPHARCVRN